MIGLGLVPVELRDDAQADVRLARCPGHPMSASSIRVEL